MRFLVLLSGASFAMIGCSPSRTEPPANQTILAADIAPGSIVIDVLESGDPATYSQYELRPSAGTVRHVKEQSFPAYTSVQVPANLQQPSGSIQSCEKKPRASSMDGFYEAYCTNSGKDEFFVEDRRTGELLSHWKLDESRSIKGFAWSPNSRSVAFLTTASRTGKSPRDLSAAASGHPVSYDTVFLNILDMRTRKMVVYEVSRNVRAAFTRILVWSD
jgi:hypothetical protein